MNVLEAGISTQENINRWEDSHSYDYEIANIPNRMEVITEDEIFDSLVSSTANFFDNFQGEEFTIGLNARNFLSSRGIKSDVWYASLMIPWIKENYNNVRYVPTIDKQREKVLTGEKVKQSKLPMIFFDDIIYSGQQAAEVCTRLDKFSKRVSVIAGIAEERGIKEIIQSQPNVSVHTNKIYSNHNVKLNCRDDKESTLLLPQRAIPDYVTLSTCFREVGGCSSSEQGFLLTEYVNRRPKYFKENIPEILFHNF